MEAARKTVSALEREEGGRRCSGAVERKDGGCPSVTEGAAAVRARQRGCDAVVERKARAEIFVFLAKHEMGAAMPMIVSGRSGGHRSPLMQGSG